MCSAYFLRTLCVKPEYGKALQSLSIYGRDPIGTIDIERLYGDLLTGDAMTMAIFQWRARNFWLEGYEGGRAFQDRLFSSLLIGLDDGIICMLLLMCPNITELDISLPPDYERSYLLAEFLEVITSPQTKKLPTNMPAYEPPPSVYITSQIFGASGPDTQWQQPRVLENLTELTLRREEDVDLDTSLLKNVTLLPSLKTLRIYGLIEGGILDGNDPVTAKNIGWKEMPQLKHLHLPECKLGYREVSEIVSFFPLLHTL